MNTREEPAAMPLGRPSLFQWLDDSRYSRRLRLLFWLLLILETLLWSKVDSLFKPGDVIAPVLFVTSKALLLVFAAYALSLLASYQGKTQMESPHQGQAGAIASALFLLWFFVTLFHCLSALALDALNCFMTEPGSSATPGRDLLTALIEENSSLRFDKSWFIYGFVSNLVYCLLTIGGLHLVTRLWPGQQTANRAELATLPAWPFLVVTFVVVASLHLALTQLSPSMSIKPAKYTAKTAGLVVIRREQTIHR